MSGLVILPAYPTFKAVALEIGARDEKRANAVLLDAEKGIFVANAHFGKSLKNPEYKIYLPHKNSYHTVEHHADWVSTTDDFRFLRLNGIDLSIYSQEVRKTAEFEGFGYMRLVGYYGDKDRSQFVLDGDMRRFAEDDEITISMHEGEILDGMSGAALIGGNSGHLLGILARGGEKDGWAVPATRFNFQHIPSLIS